MKKLKLKSNIIIIMIILCLITISFFFFYHYYEGIQLEKKEFLYNQRIQKEKEKLLSVYSPHVVTNKNSRVLTKDTKKNKYISAGIISDNMKLELEKINLEKHVGEYIKLKNINYYISYKDIEKDENYVENVNSYRYKNYIPFNRSISLSGNYKLYIDDNAFYELKEDLLLPILVDETDKYYTQFDEKLVYIKKSDNFKIIEANNTTITPTTHLAIINYHYVTYANDPSCTSTLCLSFELFDAHMKLLHDQGYFTLNMKELEWFIDKKIQLSNKSVVITVDDGWYAGNFNQFLAKYNLNATLFLITSLTSKNGIESVNFEVHSHGHNIHNNGECNVPGTRGGGILCRNKEELLADLRTSREILNNTTVFCYPFYEYNEYAIEILKEAGFTMALAGGGRDVYQGDNKFKIPRYGISSNTSIDDLYRIITVN